MSVYQAIWITLVLSSTLWAAPKPLPIGSPAPPFDLPGFTVVQRDGQPTTVETRYSLQSFADARILAFIFTCNHCPTAQAYEERIKRLAADYREKGVALVCVTSNDPRAVRLDELGYTDLGDSYQDTKLRARRRGFNFPYLYDGDEQAMANAYGPAATPHVFIFDEARKLRYRGRIDNAEDPSKIKQQETRAALDALLAGRALQVTTTRTFGCSLKWASKRDSAKTALARWNQEEVTLQPAGVSDIAALVRNETERLRLINVWATWCAPCAAEFPDLVELHRMYRGREFELVSISMDALRREAQSLAFLKKHAASFRNVIFASDDRDALAEALDPSWTGALPYTLLVAPGGKIIYRHTGLIDPPEFKQIIVEYLGRYFFETTPKLPGSAGQ
ncbi:MAG: redoxin family protein [Planctomycetes bacterium]|nr:redoxin family protein [Planctomycetota bacterium]